VHWLCLCTVIYLQSIITKAKQLFSLHSTCLLNILAKNCWPLLQRNGLQGQGVDRPTDESRLVNESNIPLHIVERLYQTSSSGTLPLSSKAQRNHLPHCWASSLRFPCSSNPASSVLVFYLSTSPPLFLLWEILVASLHCTNVQSISSIPNPKQPLQCLTWP